MQLTEKEQSLMKDLKKQEQLCVDKYTRHAEEAHDDQLKQLFESIASVEQQHLNTLIDIENGKAGNSGTDTMSKTSIGTGFTAVYTASETPEKKDDAYLCQDLLATEKHAANLYNTCVFEFAQPPLRKVLNRIQTDEQEHGEALYRYMKINSMYS